VGWIEEFLHFGMKDRCWSGLRENQQDPNGEKRYTGLELFIYLSFLRSNPYLFSLRFPFCSMTFSFVFFFPSGFFFDCFPPLPPSPPALSMPYHCPSSAWLFVRSPSYYTFTVSLSFPPVIPQSLLVADPFFPTDHTISRSRSLFALSCVCFVTRFMRLSFLFQVRQFAVG